MGDGDAEAMTIGWVTSGSSGNLKAGLEAWGPGVVWGSCIQCLARGPTMT